MTSTGPTRCGTSTELPVIGATLTISLVATPLHPVYESLIPWRPQAVPTGIGLAANGLDDGGSNLLRSCLASKVGSVWTL